MVTVFSVVPNSLADHYGIKAGDVLVSINQHTIKDVLDYRFYLTDTSLSLLIHRGPELLTVTVEKEEYDDLGLEFETYLMDQKETCRNKCIFCFIDQNPHGMRETIYFKDDDSRLSFLLGNYITLTNLKEEDIDRIISMHLSPINISVHTTNPTLRCEMMHNKHAGSVLRYLDKLAKAGTAINAQIVLCKGVNDGKELDRTLHDLAALLPAVQSIAIVPSGLTAHREGLYPLMPFTKEDAEAVIAQVTAFSNEMLAAHGTHLAFLSDEWFLTAEMPLPDEDYYEGYPQLENGVGMITSMKAEFEEALGYLEDDYDLSKTVTCSIATGSAAYPFIQSLANALEKRAPHFSCQVYEIKNDFFGNTVTVAGLVTGQDLLKTLKDKPLGDFLVIPSVMLRDEGDRFLDDTTLEAVETTLSIPVRLSPNDGDRFLQTLLGQTENA